MSGRKRKGGANAQSSTNDDEGAGAAAAAAASPHPSAAGSNTILLYRIEVLDELELAFSTAVKRSTSASGKLTPDQRAQLGPVLEAVQSFVFGQIRARCQAADIGRCFANGFSVQPDQVTDGPGLTITLYRHW